MGRRCLGGLYGWGQVGRWAGEGEDYEELRELDEVCAAEGTDVRFGGVGGGGGDEVLEGAGA
jgi:hypothetical protein